MLVVVLRNLHVTVVPDEPENNSGRIDATMF